MDKIKIGDHLIGAGEPCFIVAEIGSNHNGSFQQALQLIEVAAEADVNAVKLQHFKAAKLYPKSAGQTDYLKMARSIYDIIREAETPDDWLPHLVEFCRQRNLVFLSSPFDESSADLLEPYVPAYKIASYEMTHIPLLRHVARKGKPLLISTGTAVLEEVLHSVEQVRAEGNDQMVLLQCTASYPTPLAAANVRALVALREATGLPTGLSDHTRDPIVAPLAAVALGACVIEKHITLSNYLPGPDHKFAIEPHELKELVRRVREAEQALGHGRKEVMPAEEELRSFARRSIFTIRPVLAGEALSAENIAVLRCGKLGFGLPPENYEALLGRRVKRDLAVEVLIRPEDLL